MAAGPGQRSVIDAWNAFGRFLRTWLPGSADTVQSLIERSARTRRK